MSGKKGDIEIRGMINDLFRENSKGEESNNAKLRSKWIGKMVENSRSMILADVELEVNSKVQTEEDGDLVYHI